jgi:alkaline phosphatase
MILWLPTEWLKKGLSLLLAGLYSLLGFFGLRGGTSKTFQQYQNVILMIGDGMGDNSVKSAKQFYGVTEKLAMETMPVYGHSKTHSWTILTDSAAGATALACGLRNIDGEIATYPFDPLGWVKFPKTIAELALEKGKAAGVVTSDSTSGATPGAFSSHAALRTEEKKISKGQLASGLNLIWGGESASVTREAAEKGGFKLVKNKADWEALSTKDRSFAQFPFDDLANTANTDKTPTLKEMTVKAIETLNTGGRGFFLMVEGAHIDKFSHANEREGMAKALMEFDKAIAAALEFAKDDGKTLVLVTADHETGGIQYDKKNDTYKYTTGQHTMADVPVYVSATDAGFENGGTWKNREIGAQLGYVLGLSEEEFPTPLLTN